MTEKQWEMALGHVKRVSQNAQLKFIQIKYLHHTYLMSHRLQKIFPGTVSVCPHCVHIDAMFLYMVWECTVLAQTWHQVMEHISGVVDVQLPPDPLLRLMGITKWTKCTIQYMQLLNLAAVLFKQLIAMT